MMLYLAGLALGADRAELELERLDAAGWRRVSPSEVFCSGDRVRVSYTSSVDARVRLVSHGPGTVRHDLFPLAAEDDRVAAGQRETFGPFVIVPPTGDETLVLTVAPDPSSDGPLARLDAPHLTGLAFRSVAPEGYASLPLSGPLTVVLTFDSAPCP